MKILHIGDIAFVGSLLCRELRRKGIRADLISKHKGPLQPSRGEDWITYTSNPWEEFCLGGVNPDHYDLIHLHYLINWGALGFRLKVTKKPVVLHAHGCDTRPPTFFHQTAQRFVAGQGKALLYSTPDLLDNIYWFKGEKIYLPNPVAVEDCLEQPERYHNRVLIFATLYRLKKIEIIFEWIGGSEFFFDMIDYGPDRTYYKRIAPRNVRWIPPVRKEDVPRLIAMYPLVIGGSQDGTIRISELEAMALGVPTVFPFRYHGFYEEPLPLPHGNPMDLKGLLENRALGQRQKQWVKKYHDAGRVAEKLIAIYQQVR